jgi:hypothetical protein
VISRRRAQQRGALRDEQRQVPVHVDGVAAALGVADQPGPQGAELVASAMQSFTSGCSAALLVGSAVLLVGAVVSGLLAPARQTAAEDAGVAPMSGSACVARCREASQW